MTKLEQLKIDMQNQYQKYKNLFVIVSNKRNMIDGCLNRIAISGDEQEVERHYNALINHSIKEYKDIARECHKQWVIYSNVFDEYIKEKNNND